TVPGEIWSYRASTGEKRLWFARKAPFEKDAFEVRQEWVTSKDGTRIPMFLVYRKGLVLDSKKPILLTGYGGFNVSLTPGFRALPTPCAAPGAASAPPHPP